MLSLRSKPSILASLDVYASEILPQLFLGYDQETVPNNILDVGAGNSHTLDAFAFYRSKVHFLDLFALDLPEQGSSKRQEAYAQRAYGEVLSDCHGVKFDLCLFWDLLFQLTDPALRGLSAALQPFLGSPSQGYAVGELFCDQTGEDAGATVGEGKPRCYRIQDAQHLVRLPMTQPSTKQDPGASQLPFKHMTGWSQTQFVAQFDCQRIAVDRLQPDGRMELLFASS